MTQNNEKDNNYFCALSVLKELAPDDSTLNDISESFKDDNYYEKVCNMKEEFLSYLIKEKILKELPDNELEKNCIVIYYNDNELKHSGIVREPKGEDSVVQSREENHRAIRTHKLWEVATTYGTKVRFYKPLTIDKFTYYIRKFLMNNLFKYYFK